MTGRAIVIILLAVIAVLSLASLLWMLGMMGMMGMSPMGTGMMSGWLFWAALGLVGVVVIGLFALLLARRRSGSAR